MSLVKRRKIKSFIALTLSSIAAGIGLFWLSFILIDVLRHGIAGINWELFTEDPAPPGIPGGGLRNAFVGQLEIVFFAVIIGVPIGILAGTFIAEYARGTKWAQIISFLSDIMVSVPSIVVGTFIYAILVKPQGQLNWGGEVAVGFLSAVIAIIIYGVLNLLTGKILVIKDPKKGKFIKTVLVSISVIIGVLLFIFLSTKLVDRIHGFNGWAGAAALAFIMIPVILRTTEDMLSLVPWTLREAAFALGASYFTVIKDIVYKSAATGILTGVILSISRVAGETAPLLFTSFNNSFFTLDMNEPISSLTVTIFVYAMGPYEDWHTKAWAASFVITFFILLVTLISRGIIHWKYKG
ncbi:ABC transporter permease subunit [Persephonella sp. KM09-Lau-8]|uniref:ABC transporter permease subunit n=1 Tax=Persephonella sp. KM09-Lau-8 TaxID=1158345 RepID=UPI0006900727|nr:ABC transporter permease subunit [Persephonella sp. KM09-Lau-8]